MTASDWKQPSYVPVVGTDGQDGGLYPAGANAWNGTPIIVEPSAGNLAAGLVPGAASWLTAQTANALLNRLGKHADAVADVPSFQWDAHAALQTVFLSIHGDTTTGNANGASEHHMLHYTGSGYFTMTAPDSNSGGGGVYRTKLGQGKGFGGSSDTSEWVLGGNAANVGGDVYASSTGGTMINLAGSGGTACKARYSADRGATWADAGIAKGSGTAGLSTGAAYWNGNYYALDMRSGAGNYSTHLVKADDPTFAAGGSSTWTGLGAVTNHQGSFDQFDGRRMVGNSDILVILPRFGNVFATWDGATLSTTSLGSWSSTPAGWRGAWNGQIGLFVAANSQGQCYTSADGVAWTLVLTGAAVYDVAPHGRGFILSVTSGSLQRLHYLDMAPEKTWRVRIVHEAAYADTDYTNAHPFHLAYGRGRVMAARMVKPSGENVLAEIYTSGVNPYDRIVFSGIGV